MFRLCFVVAATAVALATGSSFAQNTTQVAPDTTQAVATTPATAKKETPKDQGSISDKLYFGGSVGMTFGNYTSIRISPLAAYKVQPKLSVGLQLGYEYVRDDRYSETFTSHNWGGSIFSRYRIIPQAYAHAEYALVNYEVHTSPTTSERQTVPFLFLGGGISQKIGPRTWAYAQVIVDVLQSNKSPYDDWEPFISFGVAAGF